MHHSSSLAKRTCVLYKENTPPLDEKGIKSLLAELGKSWRVVQEHLEKEYAFPDFRFALHFTNLVGELAEKEGHHPEIQLSWGKVKLLIWTHSISGLSENDFILAAKCDEQYEHQQDMKSCF